jgi:mxaA protein
VWRWLPCSGGHGQGVHVQADEPRAFGYQVGDTVQRHVTVTAGAGLGARRQLAAAPGSARRRTRAAAPDRPCTAADGGRRHEFDLQYQVFISPPAVRTFEIPSFRLRFNGPQRSEEVLVEAWPVTVAPLVPPEASPRRGLGELRPDVAPAPIDDRALRLRLTGGGGGAVGVRRAGADPVRAAVAGGAFPAFRPGLAAAAPPAVRCSRCALA